MAYGELYRVRYYDQILEGVTGRETILKILKKDYTGSWTYLKGDKNPIIISTKTKDDYLFSQICAGTLKLNVISETDRQFIDMFTANAREYLFELYKTDIGGEILNLFWSGYMIPDNYIEPLNYEKNYIVTLEAIDGLARLQDIDFLTEDGSYFEGKNTALTIIRQILSYTGLELNIDIALSWDEIYSTTEGIPAIVTKYLDYETFYFKEIPKCDYVLTQILQSFGARIIQNKGHWSIKEVTKNGGNHTVYRSIVGDSPTNFSFNPVKEYLRDFGYNRKILIDRDGDIQIDPAYKNFTINHDFLLKKSLISNGSFEKFTRSGTLDPIPSHPKYMYSFLNWSQSPSNIRMLEPMEIAGYDGGYVLKYFGNYGSPNYSQFIQSDSIEIDLDGRESYFSMKVRKIHFSCYLELRIGSNWINNLGEFQATQYRHHIDPTDAVNDFVTFELNISASTLTGPFTVRIYRPYFTGTPNQTIRPFFLLDEIIFKYQDFQIQDKITFYAEIDKYNNFVPDEIDSILGDVPNVKDREDIYLGTYFRFDGTNYIPTLLWKNDSNQQESLMQLLAQLIYDTHKKPKMYLTGVKLKGDFDFDSSLQISFLEDRIFLPIHYEYHDKYCVWNIDALEVLGDRLLETETGSDFIVTESPITEDNENYILV